MLDITAAKQKVFSQNIANVNTINLAMRDRKRTREQFVNSTKLHNKLKDLDYRVKWSMGKWYDKKYEVDKKDHKYLVELKQMPAQHYPSVPYIMKNHKYFLYAHGDVQHSTKLPCITKTRSIYCGSNIIMAIWLERHWGTVRDVKKKDIPFDKKKPICFWRGVTTSGNPRRPGDRLKLVEKWFKQCPEIDVGFSGIVQIKESKLEQRLPGYKHYVVGNSPIETFLTHKYLISVEGNDVATGLKWMLYSNSLVLMPLPRMVSWFMEDHLIPYEHYVPIKDDWSDLKDKFYWCEANPERCKLIINNANAYVQHFLDDFNNGFANKIMQTISDKYSENIKFYI